MITNALRQKVIRVPFLRRSGRAIWQLSHTLPRCLPFEKFPALLRWSGRPVHYHRTVSDYLTIYPERGWEKIIRPGGSYERVQPTPLNVALPPCFNPPQTVSWDHERVTFLEGARYWGGYGGSIVAHDEYLLGELSPDVWGLEHHSLFNKLKLPSIEYFPGLTAVISTPEADTNYSHWMIDLLPRLELLTQAGYGPERIDRYLINSGGHPYERETLALAGIPLEKIHFVSAASHFRCEHLVTASLRPRHWQFSLPAWVPDYLQRLVGLTNTNPPTRRLYLTRNQASFRRVVNEDSLLPVLAGSGFEVFDPGTKPVREQARLFAEAAVIISPHSSAMTNLVFCRPGVRVFELFPADYFDVSFWTAASAIGAHYFAAVGERVGVLPNTLIQARRQDIGISFQLREEIRSFVTTEFPLNAS